MANSLVVYFSLTGNTKKVATLLSTLVDGDLFELSPQVPYTSSDQPVRKEVYAKSKAEADDPSSRPLLKALPEHAERYDTFYIGFPLWWNTAPKLVHTFLEAMDLAGKTVIPFATAGGKAWGNTNRDLAISTEGANLLEGCVLAKDSTEEDLKAWLHTLPQTDHD